MKEWKSGYFHVELRLEMLDCMSGRRMNRARRNGNGFAPPPGDRSSGRGLRQKRG